MASVSVESQIQTYIVQISIGNVNACDVSIMPQVHGNSPQQSKILSYVGYLSYGCLPTPQSSYLYPLLNKQQKSPANTYSCRSSHKSLGENKRKIMHRLRGWVVRALLKRQRGARACAAGARLACDLRLACRALAVPPILSQCSKVTAGLSQASCFDVLSDTTHISATKSRWPSSTEAGGKVRELIG